MLAHHDGARVRLISRRGLDWGGRFPTIVAAVEALAVRSCIIDGELIACDANGLADFQLLRWRSCSSTRAGSAARAS
jgi:bifunctional non-homologous end joining protein LigD